VVESERGSETTKSDLIDRVLAGVTASSSTG
jgi:hypothetical protein